MEFMSMWVKGKFLGKGSYGSVFLGECPTPTLSYIFDIPHTVAIKSAAENLSWSLRLEKAFLKKFQGCKEIVHCYTDEDFTSTNEDGAKFYNIVLEYADGGTLKQVIKSRGPRMPEYEASWYAFMLLKGLSRVHGKGFVHCDVKPANVLVFNIPPEECKGLLKYNLKLADFGLAKKGGTVTYRAGKEFNHRGTLLYSSPESVVYGEHEDWLDIWSFGCIVLEMLLGKGGLWKNYLDIDSQDLGAMIAGYEDRRLIYLLPEITDLSITARDFVEKCLATAVEERWTADELLNHPFITRNQSLLKQLEAYVAYEKLMMHQRNTRFSHSGSSQFSSGVYLSI